MQLSAASTGFEYEVLQVRGMRRGLIVGSRVHQEVIKTSCRVSLLSQVEKVRIGLLNGVTALQGFHMLLELLPAY